MRSTAAQTVQKNNKIVGVLGLIAEIRNRLDSGHYNFMSWSGRTKLWLKLNEYENYAMEPHITGIGEAAKRQKQTLKDMETELRALLGSTY